MMESKGANFRKRLKVEPQINADTEGFAQSLDMGFKTELEIEVIGRYSPILSLHHLRLKRRDSHNEKGKILVPRNTLRLHPKDLRRRLTRTWASRFAAAFNGYLGESHTLHSLSLLLLAKPKE